MNNLTLLTDLYQITMMNGYFKTNTYKETAVFDMFFRNKEMLDFAVCVGLKQVIEYIENLHFDDEDIAYLESKKIFDKDFLNYLRTFEFTGEIYAAREGEIVFPYEPILIVKAPIIEAQFLETALLNIIGHQTLIATKARRIKYSAAGRSVVEFGLRRAQGPDAGIYGARASIIGGCSGTSNVLAGKLFDIAIKGTQAHSWIMSFDSELEAFEKFAEVYPDNCLLLVDTYDTIRSGIPNAIKVFKKLLEAGHKPVGIRIDSGDLAYLSKVSREMLDESGFKDAIIFVSCDLDENVIQSLLFQGAKIDVFGVGTRLITSEGMSSLGSVYKLAEIEKNGIKQPCMKISDSIEKVTNPGFKTVYRLYDKANGMAAADIVALNGEILSKPITLTHETERWKKFTLSDYEKRELLIKIYENGKLLYDCPSVAESATYCEKEGTRFWEEHKRTLNPHIYRVNLSEGLYNLKQSFLTKKGR